MSASEASDNDLTQYALGHMPMPDFEALARDIQNTTFLGQACSSSKDYVGCLTGTPSSQRLATHSWPPKAPAVGLLFYEGLLQAQAEPGVLGHWRICQRR